MNEITNSELNETMKNIIIQKKKDNILKKNILYILIIFTTLFYFYMVINLITNNIGSSTCSLILAKYEDMSKSEFSNKDQLEILDDNNYDIHYLVEQMIYNEFSPIEKKKYLNLPDALKDKLIIDYLIEKI